VFVQRFPPLAVPTAFVHVFVQRFPPLAVPTAFVTQTKHRINFYTMLTLYVCLQSFRFQDFFTMPDITSPFLSFVQARHEILKCNLRIGVHELTFIKLSSDAATSILLQFAKLNKLPDAGTARLMQEIVDGPLLDADKKQIVSAINTKLPEDARSTTVRQSLQHCEHVFNYLSANDWAVIMDGTIAAKMNVLAKRCASIGLYHPTEKTFSALVGMLMVGDLSAQSCAADALALVREFKVMYKSMLGRLVCSGTLPQTFPNDVADFKKEFPTWYEAAYSTDEPITSPVAKSVMQQMIATVPCRNTRAGCSAVQPRSTTSAKQSDVLASLCGALMRTSSSGDMLNNLQIFNRPALQHMAHSQSPSPPSPGTAALLPPPGQLMLTGAPALPALRVDVSQISDDGFALAATTAKQAAEAPPGQAAAVKSSVEDMVEAMKSQLAGRPAMKRPAAADEGNVAKRPAAAPPALGLVLGCGKCRQCAKGCKQCQKASFTGRRGPL
jgi:hypothetical protein